MKRRRKQSKNSPFWLTARYSGKCVCGFNIRSGQQIFWYPDNRKAICQTCGRAAEFDVTEEDLSRIIEAIQ